MEKLLYRPADLNKKFFAPVRHHAGDAGYDLTTTQMVTVHPGTFAQVPTNLIFAFPAGTWGLVTGRSSAALRFGLLVIPGIIDNGWRGEIFATVFNPTKRIINVMYGQRVCQLILMGLNIPEVEQALEVEMGTGDRGTNGFGSTGGH